MNKFFMRKEAAKAMKLLANHALSGRLKPASISASASYYDQLSSAMLKRLAASKERNAALLKNPKTAKAGLAGLQRADEVTTRVRSRAQELHELAKAFDKASKPRRTILGRPRMDAMDLYDRTLVDFNGGLRKLDDLNILNRFGK